MSEVFHWIAIVSLLGFALLAAIDGVWFHLWRFQLYARPEARREHLIHTIRAVLFVPAMALVFAATTSGWVLWLGIAVLAVDFGVQFWDVWTERTSRSFQGGLPRWEWRVHLVAGTLHLAMIVGSLLARPWDAYVGTVVLDSPLALLMHDIVMKGLFGGAVLLALAHLLLLHPPIATRAKRWTERTNAWFAAQCCRSRLVG